MLDCKQQILSTISDNDCCSHAFVNAVISFSAQIAKDFSNILVSSDEEILNKFSKIINNFYPNVEIDSWDNFLFLKGNIYQLLSDICFEEKNFNHFTADCDKLTILKTAFLTTGRFYYNQDNNKNSKGYSLEFVLKKEHHADSILILLQEFGFELKKIKRASNFVVYTKNSNLICDLFVKLGASYIALEIQNNLAIREMRNNANRQNNCFESNLDKTINASTEQLNAINYIINHFSIDYFDENLREVALARIANPDVSLGELRLVLNNKISRAGIKYRLDKIIDIYKKLKGENNETICSLARSH